MKFIIALVLVLLLSVAGCKSETSYGHCIGLSEQQDPLLIYTISSRNVLIGLFLFELIIPPIVVATSQFYCPVGIVPIERVPLHTHEHTHRK